MLAQGIWFRRVGIKCANQPMGWLVRLGKDAVVLVADTAGLSRRDAAGGDCYFPARLRETRWLFDGYLGGYGEAGTEGEVFVFVLEIGEVDANGDALDDLDVVSGGVLGREEGEA